MLNKEYLYSAKSVWSGHEDFAYWLTRKLGAGTVIDVGIYQGFSTMAFAMGRSGSVFGIDTFEEEPNQLQTCMDIIGGSGLNNIVLVKATSEEAALNWDGGPADIIHIDASHKYEDVKKDIELWRTWLKDTGVMLMHDVTNPAFDGPKNAFLEADKFEYKGMTIHSLGLGVLTNNKQIFEEIDVYYTEKGTNTWTHIPSYNASASRKTL